MLVQVLRPLVITKVWEENQKRVSTSIDSYNWCGKISVKSLQVFSKDHISVSTGVETFGYN